MIIGFGGGDRFGGSGSRSEGGRGRRKGRGRGRGSRSYDDETDPGKLNGFVNISASTSCCITGSRGSGWGVADPPEEKGGGGGGWGDGSGGGWGRNDVSRGGGGRWGDQGGRWGGQAREGGGGWGGRSGEGSDQGGTAEESFTMSVASSDVGRIIGMTHTYIHAYHSGLLGSFRRVLGVVGFIRVSSGST